MSKNNGNELIDNKTEKNRLISEIFNTKAKLIANSTESDLKSYTLLPVKETNHELLCLSIPKEHTSNTGAINIQFQIGSDIYITQSKYTIEGNNLLLHFDKDFYKIQRREDFRIKIPSSYNATVSIISINSSAINQVIKLIDLSAGGCAIDLPVSKLKINSDDKIELEIILGNRKAITVEAEIRRLDKDKKSAGLLFINLSDAEKIHIMSVLIDLHQELFSK
jgi:hypothetical protein